MNTSRTRKSEQNLPAQAARELSEQRNIVLARSRLALMYARRGQLSQETVDAIGAQLDAESGVIW